jgi:hypothetical protein
MRLGRPVILNLTHYPGGKVGVVPPRRGCRRAHGRPGRFAPRRRGALRASLTAAPPVGFGTLRSGRRSSPLRPDKEAIVNQGCFRSSQVRPCYGGRASRAIWFFMTRRRLRRRAVRRRKGEAGPSAMVTAAVSWRCGARRRSIRTRRAVAPARWTGFSLVIQTMIRHASHPGAVTAVSFGVHGTATGGCLMTAASLPLSLSPGVTRAAPDAVNLAPVASPANNTLRTAADTQEHSAGNFISTSGWTCLARAITAPRASRFQQDLDLRQMVSSWSEGILATT